MLSQIKQGRAMKAKEVEEVGHGNQLADLNSFK
jgi:hypothetical protein